MTGPAPQHSAAPTATHTLSLGAYHGHVYRVEPQRSQLTVLVYRSGPLAALGHNHVIACRCIRGRLYVPRNLLATRFVLRIPVDAFSVDVRALRAAQHSAAFPPRVSAAARRGTRHNMLSAAVLDAAAFPLIVIRSAGLRYAAAGEAHTVQARVRITLRGHVSDITVPVHYVRTGQRLVASGHFSLKQTALGMRPFSVFFGALRVRNRMTIEFRLVATACPTRHCTRAPSHRRR